MLPQSAQDWEPHKLRKGRFVHLGLSIFEAEEIFPRGTILRHQVKTKPRTHSDPYKYLFNGSCAAHALKLNTGMFQGRVSTSSFGPTATLPWAPCVFPTHSQPQLFILIRNEYIIPQESV